MLLAFLVTTFSKTVIVVDFYANQDNIAKNLCENRRTPTIHCYGRCQLNKRLVHENNEDKTNPERRAENRSEVLYINNSSMSLSGPVRQVNTITFTDLPSKAPVDRASAIFHPPGQPRIS